MLRHITNTEFPKCHREVEDVYVPKNWEIKKVSSPTFATLYTWFQAHWLIKLHSLWLKPSCNQCDVNCGVSMFNPLNHRMHSQVQLSKWIYKGRSFGLGSSVSQTEFYCVTEEQEFWQCYFPSKVTSRDR